MEEYVTSTQNPSIKRIKMLHNKKYRDIYGQYLVEGVKMVKEALNEGESIWALVVSRGFNWLEFKNQVGIPIDNLRTLVVEDKLFASISDTQTPQGILAVVNKKEYRLEHLLSKQSFFIVVLDQIRDPGNLGTIIRTMDAAGGDGVVLLKGCVDPFNLKVVRSTMGSIFRMPIYEVEDHIEFFNRLVEAKVHILVSHLNGSNLFEWPGGYDRIAVVVGNESEGVRQEICGFASSLVRIPMPGRAESLNASVAAGVLIYEVLRKSGK
ncbi:TrmH family RNA methyltransferase [Caldicoprobacter guelmensis]|uniref:TrmH family RNA methyltransferase n=1 Tax=Caldicoprobacter guelmensis TaxID=1170224 RepID=UPI001FB02579|nr:RNA methyltransferase [Caldicoprobacter guelmensis]MBM7582050.1 TrmH family RNA methyltransferase [Caldicoprobacter guelmensis]